MLHACVQCDCIPGRTPFFAHVFPWLIVCYYLFAAIDPTSEGEEGYEGEDFAGEGPGQPGTTGKPPLALAYYNPILLAYALVAKIAFLFL